ncbi:MAG TPA: hypothetical protein VJK26_03460, partial [Patescibacteria group bacterium]|nr:hypothetical protein [Patescibacteria group bacterium]
MLLVSGALAYRYETAEVRIAAKRELRCGWANHTGDTLVRTEIREEVVPRWQARSVTLQTATEMCGPCKAEKQKQEAEEQARAERRREREKARVEREEAKTRIPNLLGKGFKEVVAVWGQPDSSGHWLGTFEWTYEDKPNGCNTSIDYIGNDWYAKPQKVLRTVTSVSSGDTRIA